MWTCVTPCLESELGGVADLVAVALDGAVTQGLTLVFFSA